MQSNKRRKWLALCLAVILSFGSVQITFAENEVAETEETVILTGIEALKADKADLDLGFTLCVSRDLVFPKEGEHGSKISWKSSRPDIISDEGKFTVPEVITDLTVTATLTNGAYKEEKKFEITANNRSMFDVIMDYVNTMIEYGRDDDYFTPEEYANGRIYDKAENMIGRADKNSKSGLFFSMLDRDSLRYPAYYVKEWPRTGYNWDERSSGCSTSYDIWLYEILYDLTALTGDKRFEKIADDNFKFFLEEGIHESSGVAIWGIHSLYDPVTGRYTAPNIYTETHKDIWSSYNEPGWGDRYFMENPHLVNRFFELNFDKTHQHMLSWYSSTLADKKYFEFSRHTQWDGSANTEGNYMSMLNPMAFAYAWGYHYTGDPQFKEAMNSMMNWVERFCAANEQYLLTQEVNINNTRGRQAWTTDMMNACYWFMDLMPIVPEDIKERMERFIDRVIEKMDCDLERDSSATFTQFHLLRSGQVSQWGTLLDSPAYYEMWKRFPEGEMKTKFGEWINGWVDRYFWNPLSDKLQLSDYFPRTIANEMTLVKVMYEETGEEKYLDRLLEYADFAIYDFWQREGLLPSMTHAQKKYYESSWGSVQVVKAIWDAYFLDVERKTGKHPIKEAWEKTDYMPKTMMEIKNDEEFYNATKFVNER